MRRTVCIFLMVFFGMLTFMWAFGPSRTYAPKEEKDDQIHLLHADRLYYNMWTSTAQILVGNVQFEHQGTLMYCDSALYYQQTKSFDAYGHVKMLQGDTLSLMGDVLYYDGIQQKVRVSGREAILKHRGTTLYTDSLVYDKLYGVGYFPERGRLVDQDNQLTSDYGSYTPSTRQAVFNFNVRLINPLPPKPVKSELLSDTLYYNTGSGVAHVVGPSNLTQGTTLVYTENGYYDSQNDFSYLLDRSHINYVSKRIEGDSLNYDGKTKISKGYGQVVYDDFANKNRFLGNYILYDDSIGYAEAADSALCIDYSQSDTLWAHADTMKLYTHYLKTDSMYREVHAYNHVRAYRYDLQAVCDSLVHIGKDSCTTMYKDPIVWQMNQQILGEEIRIWNNDSTLDSIHVVNQALLAERMDSIHYNQVSSHVMRTYFREGEVYLNTAEGNVLTNYYPLDDDSLMIGMVHTESSELRLYMKDRQVQKIWSPATTGMLYPLDKTPPAELYLPTFAWFDYVRPKDKDDVFNWRSKKEGTELKASVRHTAPTQKLENIKQNVQKQFIKN